MDASDLCKITDIQWCLCNKAIINVISSLGCISTAVRLVFICHAYILLPRLIKYIWVYIWKNTTLLQWFICRFLQLEMSRYPTIPKSIFRTSWYRSFCWLGITYRTLEKYTTPDRCYICPHNRDSLDKQTLYRDMQKLWHSCLKCLLLWSAPQVEVNISSQRVNKRKQHTSK